MGRRREQGEGIMAENRNNENANNQADANNNNQADANNNQANANEGQTARM